jgi:hypothetical protein
MAEHLIGDEDVAAFRVPGLWWKHRFYLPYQRHRLGEPSHHNDTLLSQPRLAVPGG